LLWLIVEIDLGSAVNLGLRWRGCIEFSLNF
jgi:hypothetical protein